jgi:hypothetical protein
MRGDEKMTASASYPTYEEVQQVRKILSDVSREHWINDEFMTWRWWVLLGLTLVPLLIWWKIVDKNRAQEIALYGCLIGLLCAIVDNIGTELLWWGYPDKLFQMIPPLFPADLVLVPVSMMLVFQFFFEFKRFMIANAVLAGFMAYICEPIFIWIGYYELYSWSLTYSFLFYIAAAILARWLVVKSRPKP